MPYCAYLPPYEACCLHRENLCKTKSEIHIAISKKKIIILSRVPSNHHQWNTRFTFFFEIDIKKVIILTCGPAMCLNFLCHFDLWKLLWTFEGGAPAATIAVMVGVAAAEVCLTKRGIEPNSGGYVGSKPSASHFTYFAPWTCMLLGPSLGSWGPEAKWKMGH